ncbi:Uncharacterised protein [Chromobacterium violaceum]|uniref:Uncharacterized protein n=2 Tax=Chromobacterium violaceum TaxID=536 RepID=A0AAX2M8F8_CHRVL|nr:Uncharacterised protein [Chromobacterium violaceum]SUX32409.1 Uncharacterised protein [Chromobacterium violaceum]
MERRVFNPRTEFTCDQMELAVLMFTHDDDATAKRLGVTVTEWQRWKYGETPVPRWLWLLLCYERDQERMGPWQGFRVNGDRIVSPMGDSMRFDEWSQLREYRRAAQLANDQADLIEQLMAERDFYRENCHRQARFGLMLNKIFR